MHCVLRQSAPVDPIKGVSLNRPDSVSGVDVLDGQRLAFLLELCRNPVPQPKPNVAVIRRIRILSQHGVGASVGDDYHSVALGRHQVLAMIEHFLEGHLHLRQQANVNVPRGERCLQGHIAVLTPGHLDEADAVRVAGGLDISSSNGASGHRAGCVETKGPAHHWDIIVDRAWNSDAGTFDSLILQGCEDLQYTSKRTLASQGEELADRA
mmetsp:Transcript_30740/g.67302  ORF Transcript_30740/g.67302 Transcript_30740/m.67302 type:complete len:210 (-) Transcript_30740:619-1248(-)